MMVERQRFLLKVRETYYNLGGGLTTLGRLFQVEYAMEAINNAGSAVGILAADGIVIAGG